MRRGYTGLEVFVGQIRMLINQPDFVISSDLSAGYLKEVTHSSWAFYYLWGEVSSAVPLIGGSERALGDLFSRWQAAEFIRT